MTFGEKISKPRKEYNYTQEQFADMLGVSRQSVSKWESDIAYPETDKLIKMGKLFDCSMDYLLKENIIEKNGAVANGFTEKIMTDKNKIRFKKVLKAIAVILAAAFAIDVISMIVYFCFLAAPH